MISRGILTERRAGALPSWWLSLAVSALLPVTSVTAGSLAALRGSSAGGGALLQRHAVQSSAEDGASDDGPEAPCSCDCCDVVRRLPGEIAFGADIKCNPSTQHSSDMCGTQCSPEKEDKVLQDEIVDLERFCFFECKPAAGPKSPQKSQCIAFSEHEAAQTVDQAGNPVDPAFLYGQVPLSNQPPVNFFRNGPPTGVYSAAAASANLLSQKARVKHGAVQIPDGSADPGSPDAVDKKAAKKMAIKGMSNAKAEGAEAQLEASRLRQMEHLKQKELNAALKESGNGVVTLNPFAAIQDLNAAALKARVSAEEAALVASKAVKAYDLGRQKIWGLAKAEAGKEVLRWKKHAEDKAKKEYDARFAPTWQSKALKAAQEASKPYIEGLLAAQASVKLYNEKGFALANSASKMWAEAQQDAAKANKLPRSTIAEMNVAQSDMLDARNKAKEAQSEALESKQSFATAAEVRKGIPVYQYNAQKAAAQAVAAMNTPR